MKSKRNSFFHVWFTPLCVIISNRGLKSSQRLRGGFTEFVQKLFQWVRGMEGVKFRLGKAGELWLKTKGQIVVWQSGRQPFAKLHNSVQDGPVLKALQLLSPVLKTEVVAKQRQAGKGAVGIFHPGGSRWLDTGLLHNDSQFQVLTGSLTLPFSLRVETTGQTHRGSQSWAEGFPDL